MSITDVPARANGRACMFSVDEHGLKFQYKKGSDITYISRANVKTSVTRGDMLAVSLIEPMQMLPAVVKLTRNVLIHRPRFLDDLVWSNTMANIALSLGSLDYNMVGVITTACGSAEVQIGRWFDPVVAWMPKACTVISNVRGVILQRTSGGMSTYDVHVIPTTDPVLSINMLDHKSLPVWLNVFGPTRIVDTGPSQVSLQDAKTAQHEDDFRYYLCGTDSSESEVSDDDKEDEEFHPDSEDCEDSEDSDQSDLMASSEDSATDEDSSESDCSECDDSSGNSDS